ncbi:hypothetical protein E4U41_001176 [Claviceps citrina]|nr:hypothetical protein E4U41_001176 [Claviceps citrina]
MSGSANQQDASDAADELQSSSSSSGLSDSESVAKAIANDDNLLVPLRYPDLKEALETYLQSKKEEIEATVCFHLGVRSCRLGHRDCWRSGSFNMVLPIRIPPDGTVYMRIPIPYRIGEDNYPGNVEEKLRTEIATYIWLRQNCPDIPIPELHAFGLPDGSTARGKSLAWTWRKNFHDSKLRERLWTSLARISLSLTAVPLPRIGSLKLQPDGSIALCNRPLSLSFQMLENEGIPTDIPRHRTYTTVESYLSDLLRLHDNKLRHQPNAIHSQQDGRGQMAALTALRATMHHFIRPEYRDGPFFLNLTDLHQSNIFVDENWNIQTVIDLEWAHTASLEMHLPPFWLSSVNAVDGFDKASIVRHEAILDEYWAVYEAEEKKRNGTVRQVSLQRETWKRGSFWYYEAVNNPKGMKNLFDKHMRPLYFKNPAGQAHPYSIFVDVFCCCWGIDAKDLIDKKVQDQQEYEADLRKALKQGY